MANVTYSPAAISDIEAIWDYTADVWGLDQADDYSDDIRDTCTSLAAGRKFGRVVDVRAGYMKCLVGKHVIFYQKTVSGIAVIRVLHQSMDVDRHL